MMCPECNNKMTCNQTKHYSDPDKGFNYVERRKICTECGIRLFTIEIPLDEYRNAEINKSHAEHSE